MTLGSLFDGIGGFPLAAVRNGITPLWASEIESFPIKVTKLRFPEMAHVGDITKLRGDKLPPVDVITGGSPCQDLSVAGRRSGITGSRSGLFMEQMRLIREMREEERENGRTAVSVRPRFMAWENVPGAFSSGEGEDFRIVLEEICKIADRACYVPRPDNRRWESAGAILLGAEFSLAWRVVDAQFWGVPQRRRRIYLVADFGGLTASKILFEQESLRGNTPQSKKAGQASAAPAGGGSFAPGGRAQLCHAAFCGGAGPGAGGISYGKEVSPTLKASSGGNMTPHVLCLNDQGGSQMYLSENSAGTLRAQEHGHQPLVFENHGVDSRYNGPVPVSPTLGAWTGAGGNNLPLCIAGNIIDRRPENGGNGCGYQENVSYTLTATDHHAVLSSTPPYPHIVGALGYSDYKGINCQYVEQGKCVVAPPQLIRRLTPLECERLQGFPDGWTAIPGASDSARYKALGNSVAIPCVEYVMQGIALALQK